MPASCLTELGIRNFAHAIMGEEVTRCPGTIRCCRFAQQAAREDLFERGQRLAFPDTNDRERSQTESHRQALPQPRSMLRKLAEARKPLLDQVTDTMRNLLIQPGMPAPVDRAATGHARRASAVSAR